MKVKFLNKKIILKQIHIFHQLKIIIKLSYTYRNYICTHVCVCILNSDGRTGKTKNNNNIEEDLVKKYKCTTQSTKKIFNITDIGFQFQLKTNVTINVRRKKCEEQNQKVKVNE